MSPQVTQISKEQWRPLSEMAHLVVFQTIKPASWDRIDFALVTQDENHGLMTYVTCRETDSDSVHWLFGGAFPTVKGTVKVIPSMEACIEFCRGRYREITFRVENNNFAMLKLAMKFGFKIYGTKNYGGRVFLDHMLSFEQKEQQNG